MRAVATGGVEGAAQGLERGLEGVVAAAAGDGTEMNRGAGTERQSFEKIGYQLGFQAADAARTHPEPRFGTGAAAEIHCRKRERFIHGHQEKAGADEAAPGGEGPIPSLAQHEPAVLDGVVLIYMEVAGAGQIEAEAPVQRHGLEHVIEEADSGAGARPAGAIGLEAHTDGGLSRAARDDGGSRLHDNRPQASRRRAQARAV